MFDIKTYDELPDGMRPEELMPYFREVVEIMKAPNGSTSQAALAALDELADRQWHTYERLDRDLRAVVEALLSKYFTPSMTVECAEHAVSIIGRLGLPGALDKLEQLGTDANLAAVRQDILESVEELRSNVDDPYSGMVQDP